MTVPEERALARVSKDEAPASAPELDADRGGEVRDRLHHGIAHAGIIERVPGPPDDTDLGVRPRRAQRM